MYLAEKVKQLVKTAKKKKKKGTRVYVRFGSWCSL